MNDGKRTQFRRGSNGRTWHEGCNIGCVPAPLSRIDSLQRKAAGEEDLISFAGGLPDPKLFPKRELSAAFTSAIAGPRPDALQYGWPEGQPELRKWVSERLRARGAGLEPEQIVITSGAQQGIALIADLLFKKGDIVGVEAESYPGALDAFRARELRLGGLDQPATGYYVMPAVTNPRGTAWSDVERHGLLESAAKQQSFVIEDDAYGETVFSGEVQRPLVADAPDLVFHLGTVSKTLCPGLRVGWLATGRPELGELLKAKQASDLQAGTLAQEVLAEYAKSGHLESHLARARKAYARKAKLLREAVRRALPEFQVSEPVGGFSLWLESEREASDVDLLKTAIRHGVSFDPGSVFRLNKSRTLSLRLCYSCIPEDDIDSGIERLARALLEFAGENIGPTLAAKTG